MADKLISQLGATAGVVSTDVFEIEKLAGPPSEKATIAQLVTLLNTIYAPVTGGAYVLKAGDTMTGPLLFNADNTIDIGASGATRPRTGYFGTSVVTDLVASPAATALSFASAGTTRANFSTAGHLLFNTNNTNDIGASAGNRPRSIFSETSLVTAGFIEASNGVYARMAGNYAGFLCTGDGVMRLINASVNNFDRLQFGGTTSAFPAIKRSTTVLQARLADDSAFGTFQGILQTSVNATAAAPPVTTHTVPITDAAGQVYRVPCLV